MAALTPRVVRTARGRVEVAEAGSGPAVLVVHGMPGDWRQARTVAEDLSDRARVLLVSRPGYGRTPLSSGRSPEQQAALFAALLDALGIDAAVVLGISGGGPSSYAFAATTPGRCLGLVLACAVRSGAMEPPPAMRRLAAVPGVWVGLATTVRALAAVRRVAGHQHAPDVAAFTEAEQRLLDGPGVLDALTRFEQERVSTLRGRGLRNDTHQLVVPPPAWPAAAQLPTVVLHGDLDDVVPLAHAQAYAAAVPGARLEVLSGLGHAVPLFARDAVNRELSGLLVRR